MRGLPRRPSSCTCRLYTRLHQLSRRLEGQGSRNQKSSVSYCDKVIQFKLIAGLQDIDIKEDILSTEDKSLEETVKMIENKESGRQAKKTVGLQKPAQINKIQPEPGHLQCSHCPAYNQICHKCGRMGHFQRVCKSKKKTDVKEVVTDGTDSKANQISVVELAGILGLTAALHKVTRSVNKIKKYGRMFQNFLGGRWW